MANLINKSTTTSVFITIWGQDDTFFPPPEPAWELKPGQTSAFFAPGIWYLYAQPAAGNPGQLPFWVGRLANDAVNEVLPDTRQVRVNGELVAVRPNQKAMSAAQQAAFVAAVNALNTTNPQGVNGYATLVSFHGGNDANRLHDQHGMKGPFGLQRFLAWHRVYLRQFELALQAIDPTVMLPYWNWVQDRAIPTWLDNFKPTVVVPGAGSVGTINVVRLKGDPNKLPTAQNMVDVMANKTYTEFTSVSPDIPGYGGGLEGIHNSVHDWFAPPSSMNTLSTAPADPIFWMHHANIDRVWAVWQFNVPGQNPALGGSGQLDDAALPAQTMDPWSIIEPATRSIFAMGYTYGG